MYERIFYRLLFAGMLITAIIVLPVVCLAQKNPADIYLFAAPGGNNVFDAPSRATLHFGAGGEGYIWKGLSAGAELGYVAPTKAMGGGIGLLSVGPAYHFRSGQKFQPYVTGGYSLAFRNGTANLVNFGAGFDYWVSGRHGLRIEFRDHVDPHYPDANLAGVRVAWLIR